MTLQERNKLVLANKGLVIKIAKEYVDLKPSYTFDDIIQDGFIGLIHGIDKYNPDLPNSNFISYIANYIRFYIKNAYKHYEQPEKGKNQFVSSKEFESLDDQYMDRHCIDNFEEIALLAIEYAELKVLLKKLFRRVLTQTEIDIIETHYGLNGRPLILEEIAKIYGCTRENIRLKEAKAFRKLHRAKSSLNLGTYRIVKELKTWMEK